MKTIVRNFASVVCLIAIVAGCNKQATLTLVPKQGPVKMTIRITNDTVAQIDLIELDGKTNHFDGTAKLAELAYLIDAKGITLTLTPDLKGGFICLECKLNNWPDEWIGTLTEK